LTGKEKGKGRYAIITNSNNETHTISEWSKLCGVKWDTLYHRIFNMHWSIEDALNKKTRVYLKDTEERKLYKLQQKELRNQELRKRRKLRKQELLKQRELRKQELLLNRNLSCESIPQDTCVRNEYSYTIRDRKRRDTPHTKEELKEFDDILTKLIANAPRQRNLS
jgi:hypothetical protein